MTKNSNVSKWKTSIFIFQLLYGYCFKSSTDIKTKELADVIHVSLLYVAISRLNLLIINIAVTSNFLSGICFINFWDVKSTILKMFHWGFFEKLPFSDIFVWFPGPFSIVFCIFLGFFLHGNLILGSDLNSSSNFTSVIGVWTFFLFFFTLV